MDLLHFLKERLKFIKQLYDGATSSFVKTKRKIDAGEPPYIDNRDPKTADEPAFLAEWMQADQSIVAIGYWCLCMVQASLKAYLEGSIAPIGSMWWNSERLRAELPKKQGGSWFGRYRLLFLEDLGVDWSTGPVSLGELQQLNLTRDDLNHNVHIWRLDIERSKKHIERHPDGIFTDEVWAELGMERINVNRTNLVLAMELVEKFCAWIDEIRCNYPQYLKDSLNIGQPRGN